MIKDHETMDSKILIEDIRNKFRIFDVISSILYFKNFDHFNNDKDQNNNSTIQTWCKYLYNKISLIANETDNNSKSPLDLRIIMFLKSSSPMYVLHQYNIIKKLICENSLNKLQSIKIKNLTKHEKGNKKSIRK